jgi:S1-C subfamily serine protease
MERLLKPFAALLILLASACATTGRRGPELPKLMDNDKATFRVDILPNGHGSGVVIHEDGYILTCHHVAGEGDRTLQIEIAEGDGKPVPYQARVVAYDADLDLAVIKVDRHFDKPAVLEDPGNLHEGDEVYNIGYPYSFGKLVGRGYIMALHYSKGDLENAIVVDMPDGPGTSGSGVYAVKSGKLVGIMKLMIWVNRPGVPVTVIRALTGVDDVKRFLDRAKIPYHASEPPDEAWVKASTSGSTPAYRIEVMVPEELKKQR